MRIPGLQIQISLYDRAAATGLVDDVYRGFHELVRLHDSGVLIALCTKNDPEYALAAFEATYPPRLRPLLRRLDASLDFAEEMLQRLGRPEDRLVLVVGGSGTGKSVLLNTILGLKRPDGGHVEIFGRDVHDPTADAGGTRGDSTDGPVLAGRGGNGSNGVVALVPG